MLLRELTPTVNDRSDEIFQFQVLFSSTLGYFTLTVGSMRESLSLDAVKIENELISLSVNFQNVSLVSLSPIIVSKIARSALGTRVWSNKAG